MLRTSIIVAALLFLSACSSSTRVETPLKTASLAIQGVGGLASSCAAPEGYCYEYVSVSARVTNTGEEPISVGVGNFTSRTVDDTFTGSHREFGTEDCAQSEVIYPLQGRTCHVEFHFDTEKPPSEVFPMRIFYVNIGVESAEAVINE